LHSGFLKHPPEPVDQIDMALPERQKTDKAVEALEQFVLNAKPVPLTDQVRFDKREFWRLLEDLREAVAYERGKNNG
jgi:uncharacterized protein (DUF1684 family)